MHLSCWSLCLIIPSQSRLAAGSIPAHFYTLDHLNRLASRAHSLESLGYLFSTPLSHTPLSYYIHHSWDCFHIRSESSLSVSLVTLMLSQLPFYLLLISLTLSLSNLADLIIPCLFSLLHSSHLSLDHLILPSPFYILNIVPLHSKSVVVKECRLMNWVNVNSLLSIQGGSCSRRSSQQTSTEQTSTEQTVY